MVIARGLLTYWSQPMGCGHEEGHSPWAVSMMKVTAHGLWTWWRSARPSWDGTPPVDYISHAKHIEQHAFPQVKVEVKQLGLGNVLQALWRAYDGDAKRHRGNWKCLQGQRLQAVLKKKVKPFLSCRSTIQSTNFRWMDLGSSVKIEVKLCFIRSGVWCRVIMIEQKTTFWWSHDASSTLTWLTFGSWLVSDDSIRFVFHANSQEPARLLFCCNAARSHAHNVRGKLLIPLSVLVQLPSLKKGKENGRMKNLYFQVEGKD